MKKTVSFLSNNMVNFSAIIDFIKSDLRTISGSKEKPQRTLLSFFETVSNYDPQNDVPELEKLEQAVNEAHKGGEDSIPFKTASDKLALFKKHSNELVQLRHPAEMLHSLGNAKEKLETILTEVKRPTNSKFEDRLSEIINFSFVKKEKDFLDKQIVTHIRILFSKTDGKRCTIDAIINEITHMQLLIEEIEKGLSKEVLGEEISKEVAVI